MPDPLTTRWRTGRRVGRTIYLDVGDNDPNDGRYLIGIMDTPELADEAVTAHNALIARPIDAIR